MKFKNYKITIKRKKKDILFVRNDKKDNLSDFLQSLSMNKYIFKFNDLKEKFKETQLSKFDSCECTVLDFFILNENINVDFIINIKKYIDTREKENILLQNFEFKLKTSEKIKKIFNRIKI